MLILDFYVDEPACFGVPPYLSPYARYAAGALVSGGKIPPEKLSFLTVDQWRAQGKALKDDPELVAIVAGHTVPGKYLGGKIGTVTEIVEFLQWRKRYQPSGVTLVGGPIRYASPEIRELIREAGGYLVRGDLEFYLAELAASSGKMKAAAETLLEDRGPALGMRRSYDLVDRWSEAGAFLTNLHPNFPYLILELETYRGCTRSVFCSFCTEAFYGRPEFRNPAGIFAEVAELNRLGNRFFRLGRQADLMTYLPDMEDFQNSFPRPRPESLELLYSGIRNAAPNLKLLHLDNINPGLIATFPDESREISRIICDYNTAGDTAAMGLETVDPVVVKLNDLKCSRDEAMTAIEIINENGARRSSGIPKLLPGINLIHGLPGESDTTFQQNYEFLLDVMNRGLLLRRINIRQVVSYKNTKMRNLQDDPTSESEVPRKRRRPDTLAKKFIYYRNKIRKEIDQPMLLKTFPPGTKIAYVIPESKNQGYILGRQLGSYPVTIKIPIDDPHAKIAFVNRTPVTVIILGAEERSLIGLTWPLQINQLSQRALEHLPGAGKKRASKIMLSRPVRSFQEFLALLEARADQFPVAEADCEFSNWSTGVNAPGSGLLVALERS
jgi:radical SAM superfamily enzyme with C-terminal helix-hairpin-helix motif